MQHRLILQLIAQFCVPWRARTHVYFHAHEHANATASAHTLHTCLHLCAWMCSFTHSHILTGINSFICLLINIHQSSNFAVAAWLITYAHIFMACFTLFWQLASTSLPWRHMARVRFACWEGVHPESDALVMSHFASLNGCETLWSLTE